MLPSLVLVTGDNEGGSSASMEAADPTESGSSYWLRAHVHHSSLRDGHREPVRHCVIMS